MTLAHHNCATRVLCGIIWLSFMEANEYRSFSDHTQSVPHEKKDGGIRGGYNYSLYQRYSMMVKELNRIEKSNDELLKITLFSIGETFENRTLWAIKLQEVNKGKTLKKTIVVDGGAHAREWIAPSTCMYLINELILPTGSMRKVLTKFDWVIIPLLNPDGYVFTWEDITKRLWRKNRSYDDKQLKKYNETGDPLCIGVDINRNFNKNWGGVGAPINNPCDETYAGSKPFSEKESYALAEYLRSVENDVITYVTLHSYGQAWNTPWGFTSKRPKKYKEMKRVAELAVEKMKDRSGVSYSVGPSHDVMYAHSGSSIDWVYSKLDIPYTYLIEMMPEDNGAGTFELPASMMVKNAKDITVGLLTMALNIKEEETKS